MGANKPVAPASLLQVGGAGRVVGKKSLELWERLWEPKIATLVNVHEHGRTLPLVAVGDNRIGNQSIGKPLPGRTNIVVSREPAFAAPGILVARGLDAALGVARGDALRRGVFAIMVIGGADLYAQAMPLASRLEITRVHASPPGDALFPTIDEREWRETARREVAREPEDEATLAFVRYERAASAA